MRKFLSHDQESGELRLVYTDLWAGNHERTEYRVMSDRAGGHVVRNRADLDGTPVHGSVPGLHIRTGPNAASTFIWTEEVATGLTVKTACPKSVNARRKCSLCA